MVCCTHFVCSKLGRNKKGFQLPRGPCPSRALSPTTPLVWATAYGTDDETGSYSMLSFVIRQNGKHCEPYFVKSQ